MSQPLPEDDLTVSLRPFHRQSPTAAGGRAYLLMLEGSSSATFDLPPTGEVVIGRSQEAHLRLGDSSASRRHGRLVVTPRDAVLMDLGSHNGTRVNSERITGPRVLTSGDVMSICTVTLVYHRDARAAVGGPILEAAALRQRLEEEADRALRYRRPLGLLCVRFAEGVDRALVPRLLDGQLRLIDALGWDGPGQLLVLLPELEEDEVAEIARRIADALTPAGAALHAGYATCPATAPTPTACSGRCAPRPSSPRRGGSSAPPPTPWPR